MRNETKICEVLKKIKRDAALGNWNWVTEELALFSEDGHCLSELTKADDLTAELRNFIEGIESF